MKKTALLLLALSAILHLKAGTAIYDPAKPETSKTGSNTLSWIQGGDITPKIEVLPDGLSVTYTGTRGTGRLHFREMALSLPEKTEAAGLRIVVDAAKAGKLSFYALFKDKTDAAFSTTLKEGHNDFVIRNEQLFRRSKEPVDWLALSTLCLDNNDPELAFTLRGAEIFIRPSIALGNIPPVYDASNPKLYAIRNYTHHWIPNGNLKPVIEEKDGVLEISYEGNAGWARTNFPVPSLESLPSRIEITGIKITLDSNADEFEKLKLETTFLDQTDAQFQIALSPGMKSYELTVPIFRRAKTPVNWRKLSSICIDNAKASLRLKIVKLELMTKESSLNAQEIPVLMNRRVAEVLPEGIPAKPIPLNIDFKTRRELPSASVPAVMYLAGDKETLQIKVISKFATGPVAQVADADGPVFQDEALELFFSPWLDNIKFIQFAVNAAGTVFDQKRDFDVTAAGIIYDKKWNLTHEKKLNYTGAEMVYDIKIPFRALQFDPQKQPLLGFQAVQSYGAKRPVSTVCWNPATEFPNPEKFGVLLFNETPFGDGKLAVRKLETLYADSSPVMTLRIAFAMKNILAGKYALKINVSSPGEGQSSRTAGIQHSGGDQAGIAEIELPRRSGRHTLFLRLEKNPGSALLTAVDFLYTEPLRSKFGQVSLCPEVKEFRTRQEKFSIDDKTRIGVSGNVTDRILTTARLFADEFRAYTGIDGNISDGTAKIELRVDPSLALPPEGYAVEITPQKILLTGQDEAGLYYATRTLMQIIKSPTPGGPVRTLPALSIRDWPDCPNRVFRICHPEKYRGTVPKDPLKVDDLLDYLQRFCADQKYNVLLLDLGSMTRFQRRSEFNGPERVVSLEDWRKIADFCRARSIRLVPQLQFGSHEVVWLLSYHPRLAMPGWRWTGDIRNAEHNRILFDCMDDLLEATGADSFMPKFDEFYHIRSNEPLLPEEEYRNAFIAFLKEVHAELGRRKVRMMMFDDMLFPFTNGAVFNCYKVIDEVPQDIVILHWGGRPVDTAVHYFADRGFEVWNSGTIYVEYAPETLKLLKGFGASPYNLGLPTGLRDEGGSCYSFNPVFHAADVAWNLHRPKGHPALLDRLVDGTLPAWRATAAAQPDPAAGEKTLPIDLMPYCNETLSGFAAKNLPGLAPVMPEGRRNPGNIPMLLKNNIVRLDQTSRISIPVSARASSAVFLLTGWYPTAKGANLKNLYSGKSPLSAYSYGYPAGVFEISYADKTKAEQPLKLHAHFDWIDTEAVNRATSLSRHVMPVDAGNGRNCFFYQVEWINPHPEKEIEQIRYIPADDFDFTLLLAAATLRLPAEK